MPIYALDGHVPQLPVQGWIAPDAQVIGQVELGEETSLWFGAVLRGDNARIVLGARSNIQDGAVLHVDPSFPLLIGEDVTVGHRAILHGCTVGDGTLIGMGATILNGARIGRSCLVGAGALVTEGKEFPDGALILGSPARVVRMLDEAAVARLRDSAARYMGNWRRFAAGLRRLEEPRRP